jgi:hypothetical protein
MRIPNTLAGEAYLSAIPTKVQTQKWAAEPSSTAAVAALPALWAPWPRQAYHLSHQKFLRTGIDRPISFWSYLGDLGVYIFLFWKITIQFLTANHYIGFFPEF